MQDASPPPCREDATQCRHAWLLPGLVVPFLEAYRHSPTRLSPPASLDLHVSSANLSVSSAQAAKVLGTDSQILFDPEDLFERKNLGKIDYGIKCMFSNLIVLKF